LVAGSRRYNALVKAGKPKIRAIVKNMDDVEALEVSISENIGRKDLSLYEETISVKKLHELLMNQKKGERRELLFYSDTKPSMIDSNVIT